MVSTSSLAKVSSRFFKDPPAEASSIFRVCGRSPW
ncbi:hypothetical protein A2U01_0065770, partial [Trifolium medium]|nr:hypothetical protein [Trifolium medium]